MKLVKYILDELKHELAPEKRVNKKKKRDTFSNIPSGAAIKNQKTHCLTFRGLEFLSSEI